MKAWKRIAKFENVPNANCVGEPQRRSTESRENANNTQ